MPSSAGTEERRVRHRVDRVEIGAHHARDLADAQVARGGRPKAAAETLTPSGPAGARRSAGRRARPRLRELVRIAVDGRRDVTVGREADVVEKDLVEARSRCCGGEVDVVLPDPLVVRVRPGEPGTIAPDRPVAAPDRHVRPGRREDRILERHDAADEIDARLMREARRPARGVVIARRPDVPHERNTRRREPDLAVLLLDVELERGHAVVLEREVLLELPRKGARPEVTWTPRARAEADVALRTEQWSSRRSMREGSTCRRFHRRAAPTREEDNAQEERADERGASLPLSAPHRGPPLPETARSGRPVERASTPRVKTLSQCHARQPVQAPESGSRIARVVLPTARSGVSSTRAESA